MRIYILTGLFIFFFTIITLRLFYWQVIKADELSAKAEVQHFSKTEIQALRGQIRFSDGSIIVSSKPSFTLYGLPKLVPEDKRKGISSSLAQIISSKETDNTKSDEDRKKLTQDIRDKLSEDLNWVVLKKNISLDTKNKIQDLNIRSIGFDPQMSRFYSEGSQAAQLLGFVGSDTGGQEKGYFGLEGYYDRELRGKSGSMSNEKDALGLPILIGRFLKTDAINGKNLTLYIDKTVQYIVENNLKKGMEQYGAKVGSVVVMDPKTGGILAMASYPNYDPSIYNDFPNEYYKNPVVADHYEPGSTFKVLVMSAAINEGMVNPETQCDICSGPVSIGGFTIKTWNDKYYSNATMKNVIVHSDNTGMVFVSKKLGLDKLYSYIENFGFGKKTEIDLEDEAWIDLRPKNDWHEIDLATASFGQGIAVTPIQMIRAVSVIANGGYLMEPHVVKRIEGEDGAFDVKPKKIRQVISPATAKTVTDLMVAAVDGGEGNLYRPKGFKIAGKTGTAQIPIAGHYESDKTIASFVGFAPADDPKFVMLVRYDQPQASQFGSLTAAPTFYQIAKELFTYFKIAPSS